ncbi:MAG TPA: transglycosylase domain-containing protein [Candidatus Limnocylindrales bacterium]|nr:transglycosylase domain-containing protein [Candidatus Limnocylindrales bacterium]
MPDALTRSPSDRPPLQVVTPGWRPRRRLSRPAILLVAVLGLTALLGTLTAIGLLVTPPVDNLRGRVQAVLVAHGGGYVPLAAVPDQLSEAVIATEDERFYQHRGIDVQGLLRALAADLYHHRALEGASTLSQQLVKNLYMNGNDDNWRKPEDLLLALKLEAAYSKHTILESYLNSVYYGHGAWGIQRAAQVYFSMKPAQLDLARASMLAGLPQSPSYYDLYRNPCSARARQFAVLAQMAHVGYITAEQAARAYAEPIGFPCK